MSFRDIDKTHNGKPGRPMTVDMNVARYVLPEDSPRTQKRFARAHKISMALENGRELWEEALACSRRENGTFNVSRLLRIMEWHLISELARQGLEDEMEDDDE